MNYEMESISFIVPFCKFEVTVSQDLYVNRRNTAAEKELDDLCTYIKF